jgi:hypothetical protein
VRLAAPSAATDEQLWTTNKAMELTETRRMTRPKKN